MYYCKSNAGSSLHDLDNLWLQLDQVWQAAPCSKVHNYGSSHWKKFWWLFLETHLPGYFSSNCLFRVARSSPSIIAQGWGYFPSNDAGDSLPIDVAAWCKLVSSIESWLGLRRAFDLGHSACHIWSFVLLGCCTSRQAFGWTWRLWVFIPSIARIGRMVIEKEATVSLQLLRVAGCIGCQAAMALHIFNSYPLVMSK